MQLLEYFKDLTLHPKNAEELKGLILQLAVQGKLTQEWRKENPDVEPASDLLKTISNIKAQLVREGKLKKEVELAEIEEAEIIDGIPETWDCCRLGEVIEIIRGITFPSSEKSKTDGEGKIPCLRTANVQENIEWDDLLYVDRSFVKRDDQILRKDDIIMSMANSRELVGKVALLDFVPNREFTLGGFISSLRTFGFFPSYLMIVLRSPKTRNELISSSSQTTNIANVSISKLRPLVIQAPPLAEQKAIVEVVNQLFAEVEQLEALTKERMQLKEDFVISVLNQLTQAAESDVSNHWDFLKSQFSTFFTEKENIKKLREAILQLAVQGKLTHHWRTDVRLSGVEVEHASVLLEKIKAEKEQLIKEKKIKKEKPLPPISEEEIPYELPEGWVWCRLGDSLLYSDAGKSPDCEKRPVNGNEWGVLTTTAIQQNKFDQNANKVLPRNFEINPQQIVEKGDILITRAGPINRTGIVCKVDTIKYNLILSDKTIRLKYIETSLCPDYIVLALNSSQIRELLLGKMIGMASSQVNISQSNIKGVYFPMPPFDEQKAIVENVNGIMALCDQLEKETEYHQTTQEQWMQSCLREVL